MLDDVNWTIAGLGILIVFVVLCLLVFLLRAFGSAAKKIELEKVDVEQKPASVSSEKEKTAIALALSLFYEEGVHDKESDIITIHNADRRYSHWNLKIYNT